MELNLALTTYREIEFILLTGCYIDTKFSDTLIVLKLQKERK